MSDAGDVFGPTKLLRRDVELAYQLLLGRRPESASVIDEHLKASRTVGELRERFLASAEYQQEARRVAHDSCMNVGGSLDWPKIDVEVSVGGEKLEAMLRNIESNWALLGQNEPHWSVLSHDSYKPGKIDTNLETFYDSGRKSLSYFVRAAERAGLDYRRLSTCFEFGCGVGRLSVWLANMFPQVMAVDISKPHIDLAESACTRYQLSNVQFRQIRSVKAIDELEPFDCFISLIVFQHNPPPVIATLLSKFLSKLLPGGLAYFQLPTYRKGVTFRVDDYLNSIAVDGRMEIHVLPQAVLWAIIEDADCQLADIREDDWVGHPDFISNSILVQKRP